MWDDAGSFCFSETALDRYLKCLKRSSASGGFSGEGNEHLTSDSHCMKVERPM